MPIMMPWLLATLCAGSHDTIVYHRDDAGPVRVTVDPADRAPWTIDPRLCGNFLEHLGGVIYQGVSAQVLPNPTLEPTDPRTWERVKGHQHRLFLGRQTPLPWRLLPGTTAAVVPDATCNQQALRLTVAEHGGLAVETALPLHRTGSYRGRLYLRSEQPPATVRLVIRRGEQQLAAVELPKPAATWQVVTPELTVPRDGGHGLDVCLELDGPGWVELDNLELTPTDAVDGFMDPDVIRMAREWQMPILRYPGGNFVSGYHWRGGVGPLEQRRTIPNPAWGGLELNTFGTDEFMRFCELLGTKPMICVNLGNGTAEEAAAWVQYCNGAADTPMGRLRADHGHPEPYDVRLWEVGNEIYGNWQIGHCDKDENLRRYNAWSKAMLAADPTIELIATGNHGDFAWQETLAKQAERLTILSEHPLVGPWNMPERETNEQLWPRLAAQPWWYERTYLPALAKRFAAAGRPDLKVAVTEWGIIGGGPPRDLMKLPHAENQAGAVYAGAFLNALVRGSDIVPIANITGLLHGGGLRKRQAVVYGDPQYYVSRLYPVVCGGQVVKVESTGPGYDPDHKAGMPAQHDVPWIDAAAVESAGKLYVFLVNRHWSQSFPVELNVPGWRVTGSWRVETPGGGLVRNSWDHPRRIEAKWVDGPVSELAGLSVVRVDLVGEG